MWSRCSTPILPIAGTSKSGRRLPKSCGFCWRLQGTFPRIIPELVIREDIVRFLKAGKNGAQRAIAGSLGSYKNGIPLGKPATPGEIADAVLFQLSDRACHILGHYLACHRAGTNPRNTAHVW